MLMPNSIVMSIVIFLPRHAEKVTVSVGDKQLRYHTNFCFSVSA